MENKANKKDIPSINGTLRAHSLQIPEVIWKAKGMLVLGRRIKSVLFSTDIAIIRNCNADAVLAVYPFTPQQIISQTIINASSIPVFAGVGGGTTTGVNGPMKNDIIRMMKQAVDIPIIVTVLNSKVDIQARLDAGASILNVSAAANTPQVVRDIRKKFPKVPIIATGGPTDESILETIEAGANTISYTPPSCAQIFGQMMDNYRADADKADLTNTATDQALMQMFSILD